MTEQDRKPGRLPNKKVKVHTHSTRKEEESSSGNKEPYNFKEQWNRSSIMVDYDAETFKFNDLKNKDFRLFDYEDPIYESFDIQIDPFNSALMNVGEIYNFYNSYLTIYDINNRLELYDEFIDKIKLIFSKKPDSETYKNKSYYINSISGMDKLNAKIVDYRKDKITIELHEDVTLLSTYIAELYNNLTYCYINQRVMIPENLLRFNLIIKISDWRNFRRSEKSYIMYKLYDCNFDFYNSKSFSDNIPAAGINMSRPTPSKLDISIYYKSIERILYPRLTDHEHSLNDHKILDNKTRGVVLDNDKNVNILFYKKDNNVDLGESDHEYEVKPIDKSILNRRDKINDKSNAVDTFNIKRRNLNIENPENLLNSQYQSYLKDQRYKKRKMMIDSLLNEVNNQIRGITRPLINIHVNDKMSRFVKNLYYTDTSQQLDAIERRLIMGAQNLIRKLGSNFIENIYGKEKYNLGMIDTSTISKGRKPRGDEPYDLGNVNDMSITTEVVTNENEESLGKIEC
jgi:hypothetical protein